MQAYLISRPHIDFREYNRFLADEGLPKEAGYHVEPASEGEMLVEIAGRLCYMSYGKGRKTTPDFIRHIVEVGHYSVLEHANWTFIFTGVSRSLTHELVRHRHFSFSQLSQRYVDESAVTFIRPPGIPSEGEAYEEWKAQCEVALDSYKFLVAEMEKDTESLKSPTERRKHVRQSARSVLPNCTETKITVTGNARTWREFIQKRMHPAADVEIRALATLVFQILKKEAPSIFADLETA